jgi:hypothetical protein
MSKANGSSLGDDSNGGVGEPGKRTGISERDSGRPDKSGQRSGGLPEKLKFENGLEKLTFEEYLSVIQSPVAGM